MATTADNALTMDTLSAARRSRADAPEVAAWVPGQGERRHGVGSDRRSRTT